MREKLNLALQAQEREKSQFGEPFDGLGPQSIEPQSREYVTEMMEELEEVHASCESEFDQSVVDLLLDHGDVNKVAEVLGVTPAEVKNSRGKTGKRVAKRQRDQGKPVPRFEKHCQAQAAYHPRHKQSNAWPAVSRKGNRRVDNR